MSHILDRCRFASFIKWQKMDLLRIYFTASYQDKRTKLPSQLRASVHHFCKFSLSIVADWNNEPSREMEKHSLTSWYDNWQESHGFIAQLLHCTIILWKFLWYSLQFLIVNLRDVSDFLWFSTVADPGFLRRGCQSHRWGCPPQHETHLVYF